MSMGKKSLALILFIYYVFIAAGNTLLGPIVPAIKEIYNMKYFQISYIASMSYLGGFMSFIGGIIVSFTGYFTLIFLSTVLLILGLLSFPITIPSLLMYLSYFLIGLGTGFYETVVNPIIGYAYKEKKGMVLNLIHIGWNIGAFIGPAIITLTNIYGFYYMLPYYIITLLLSLMVPALFSIKKEISNVMPEEKYSFKKVYADHKLLIDFLLVSMIMFLYLGIEQAVNIWLPSLLYENKASKFVIDISLGLFWISLGVGRVIWSPFVDRIGFRKVIGFSSVFSLLFIALGIFERSQLNILYWIIVGFFYAPMFPTIYGLCLDVCKEHIGIFSGIMFSIGILGSFIYSLLIGFLSSTLSLYTAFYIVLISPLLILLILFIEYKVKNLF